MQSVEINIPLTLISIEITILFYITSIEKNIFFDKMNKKGYEHQNINRRKVRVMFKRKAYEELLSWKKEWNGKYACLLEGARRVGKTTIAEEFARNEYDSYILIDFSNTGKEILDIFEDISKLDRFFLRLQIETGEKKEAPIPLK